MHTLIVQKGPRRALPKQGNISQVSSFSTQASSIVVIEPSPKSDVLYSDSYRPCPQRQKASRAESKHSFNQRYDIFQAPSQNFAPVPANIVSPSPTSSFSSYVKPHSSLQRESSVSSSILNSSSRELSAIQCSEESKPQPFSSRNKYHYPPQPNQLHGWKPKNSNLSLFDRCNAALRERGDSNSDEDQDLLRQTSYKRDSSALPHPSTKKICTKWATLSFASSISTIYKICNTAYITTSDTWSTGTFKLYITIT